MEADASPAARRPMGSRGRGFNAGYGKSTDKGKGYLCINKIKKLKFSVKTGDVKASFFVQRQDFRCFRKYEK